MSHIVGAIDEMRSFTEEGVDPSGNDHCLDLTLLAGGPGEHLVPGVLGHRKRLSGKGRLIDLQGIALQETGIGGDDVTQLNADQITGNEDCRILLRPLTISQNLF